LSIPKRFDLASLLLIVALTGVNVYRASTQSITHDEALTFEFFAAPPDFYDANQHILNSQLAWLTTSMLGVSEFALRLPSLLGGILYFAAIFRLARYLFGDSLQQLLAVAVLALNPLVLDFLSAARGYGMAIGFLTWAVYELIQYLREGDCLRAGPLWRAGLALGLSVSANLTLLFPAVTLLAVLPFLIPATAPGPATGKKRRKRTESHGNPRWRAIALTGAPFLIVCWIFLSGPLSHARRENFYAGESSLYRSIRSLVQYSFSHNGNLAETPITILAVAGTIIAALLIVAAARSHLRELRLVGYTLAATVAVLVLTHYTLGIPYPADRTALYAVPLLTIAGMMAAARHRWAAPVAIVVAAGYLLQFETSYYALWRDEEGARRAMELARADHASHPSRSTVGLTWRLEPPVNFYRVMFGLTWMPPATRAGADGIYDYYLVTKDDAGMIPKYPLLPVYTNPDSGLTLAVRQ
jgi:4-amino-4-deoxy-L-arabinose transferase-like glycosyltransferase